MPTNILLNSSTDQGMRNVNDTVKRVNAFKEQAKSKGVDAPDDTVATAVAISLAKLGNVRTQTLRAFSQAEAENILSKVT